MKNKFKVHDPVVIAYNEQISDLSMQIKHIRDIRNKYLLDNIEKVYETEIKLMFDGINQIDEDWNKNTDYIATVEYISALRIRREWPTLTNQQKFELICDYIYEYSFIKRYQNKLLTNKAKESKGRQNAII